MKANTPQKFETKLLTPEKRQRLSMSFEECNNLTERDLKCPHCGSLIQGVFSDAVGHLRIKCNKCKANMVLNLAYFRTKKGYTRYRKTERKRSLNNVTE